MPQGLLGMRLEEHGQGVDDDLENVLVRVAHTSNNQKKDEDQLDIVWGCNVSGTSDAIAATAAAAAAAAAAQNNANNKIDESSSHREVSCGSAVYHM